MNINWIAIMLIKYLHVQELIGLIDLQGESIIYLLHFGIFI